MVSKAFDKIGKEIEKAMKQDNVREFPMPYVGTVIALHAFLTTEAADKESKKSLSKTAAKAFNALTQKLKKMTKEMEAAIKKYESVIIKTFIIIVIIILIFVVVVVE